MNLRLLSILVLTLLPWLSAAAAPRDESYVAYSLRTAASLARSASPNPSLTDLAGMTRVIAVVIDGDDVILVGRAISGLPVATLDDLVVALRARQVNPEWPLVDIRPDEKTQSTKKLKVTFGGRIDATAFGATFLAADMALKSYSLNLSKMVEGIPSYRDNYGVELLAASNAAPIGRGIRWLADADVGVVMPAQGRAVDKSWNCAVKFWFVANQPFVFANRGGVFCIKELDLAVLQEIIPLDGSDPTPARGAAERFAKDFTQNLPKISAANPAVARLKILYDLTAVADNIDAKDNPAINYFLDSYKPKPVTTPADCDMRVILGLVDEPDGGRQVFQIEGGVTFQTQLRWLEKGDITMLRDIVIKSRPDAQSLTWALPLESWTMPNASDLVPTVPAAAPPPGVGLITQSVRLLPLSIPPGAEHPAFTGFKSLGPGGVILNPIVTPESHIKDTSGELDRVKKQLINSRPISDPLDWPAPMENKK